MTNNLIHIVEAIIFAAGVAIKRSDILAHLPEGTTRKELNDAIKGLEQKYQDPCGIVLLSIGDKVQFASNKEYGDTVAAALKPVKERELSRALLEVMSIIAYKQPVTRGEIEDIRGGRSADYAITTLMRVGLIEAHGRRDTPGRPVLYITTELFLKRFGLRNLDDLPDYKEVLDRLVVFGNYNRISEGLYREVDIADSFEEAEEKAKKQELERQRMEKELDEYMDPNESPDFLQGEEYSFVEADEDVSKQAAAADDDDEDSEDVADDVAAQEQEADDESDDDGDDE